MIRARILEGPHAFYRNGVTLVVIDDNAALMADGSWKVIPEGTMADDVGIFLPSRSIEAVAQAIQEWQGHTSHADTEARVLREWLTVERERVDRAFDR